MTTLEANLDTYQPERRDDVMQRLARGEVAALDDLYWMFSGVVHSFALRLCGDVQAAEDVTQETFIAVWYGARRFRGQCSTKTWLLRIAYHRAMSWLRSRRPQVSIDDALEIFDHASADEVEMVATREQIQQALDQLSVSHRAVIELTFAYDLTGAEVARVLNCPLGTVKSRISYALRHMRKTLNALQSETSMSRAWLRNAG